MPGLPSDFAHLSELRCALARTIRAIEPEVKLGHAALWARAFAVVDLLL
jgi:hypothetical protein